MDTVRWVLLQKICKEGMFIFLKSITILHRSIESLPINFSVYDFNGRVDDAIMGSNKMFAPLRVFYKIQQKSPVLVTKSPYCIRSISSNCELGGGGIFIGQALGFNLKRYR
jgi:hypothetical protein